jgi:sensor histidine kinase YesM
MISQIAAMENAVQASKLMNITTDLLRYSLDKSTRMARLEEEIICVKNYIEIQRLRFGERISCELDMDEALPDVMLPGMLLQPLLENAVSHGVKEMLEGAVITVGIHKNSGTLVLSVEDNGRGMSAAFLEELQSNDFAPGKEHPPIGLANTKKRLELLYGDAASFHIESTEDVGTIVTITIPLMELGSV